MLHSVHLQQQNNKLTDFKHTTRAHFNRGGGGGDEKSEESGYLDNLLPIDIVIADKRF